MNGWFMSRRSHISSLPSSCSFCFSLFLFLLRIYIPHSNFPLPSPLPPPPPQSLPQDAKEEHPSPSTYTCNTPPPPTLTPDPSLPHPTLAHHTLHHHTGYVILVAISAVILITILIVFSWRLCSAPILRKRRTKYKSVSKFIPLSYSQPNHDGRGEGGGGIAIPEFGLPKSGEAEREMLLNESDEDEI